ncbi:hypothetical protein L218DRAFT_956328 [Marasmius fiardii PR-910]|nr:hypothetical protein L218DRAFT_956328 [Marasmius fiardii PR-910]
MLTTSAHTLFFLLYYLLNSTLVAGILQTRTIDDQAGDSFSGTKPTFTGPWNKGPQCKVCSLQPDPTRAYHGTWTEITHKGGDPVSYVEISFLGVEIDVFCIIPNSPPNGVVGTYDLKFTLDGAPVGDGFYHDPSFRVTDNFTYDAPVFSINGLENKPHRLVLNATSTTRNSVVLFDYAMYKFEDGNGVPPSTTTPTSNPHKQGANDSKEPTNKDSHKSKATIIAASVLAPLFLITLTILLLLYGSRRFGWLQRKQRPSDKLPAAESQSRAQSLPPSSTNSDNGFQMRIQRWASHVAGQKLAHPFSPPSEVPSTCRTQASVPASIPASRERPNETPQGRPLHTPKKWVVCNPSTSSEGASAR